MMRFRCAPPQARFSSSDKSSLSTGLRSAMKDWDASLVIHLTVAEEERGVPVVDGIDLRKQFVKCRINGKIVDALKQQAMGSCLTTASNGQL